MPRRWPNWAVLQSSNWMDCKPPAQPPVIPYLNSPRCALQKRSTHETTHHTHFPAHILGLTCPAWRSGELTQVAYCEPHQLNTKSFGYCFRSHELGNETPVQQLDPGKGKTKRAYLWCYRSNDLDEGAGLAVFDTLEKLPTWPNIRLDELLPLRSDAE